MGRSVSVPRGAADVAYTTFEREDEDSSWEWDNAIDDLQCAAMAKYPSLRKADRWLGNENHIILENSRAFITVSEYCGLVAIAVMANDECNALDQRWASQVKVEFLAEAFGGTVLISKGTASNGEQFFTPKTKSENKGQLGLGFTSKEGWL